MGFPDNFVFNMSGENAVDLAYRGLGNAVPVPLAAAIGRAHHESLIEEFWKSQEEKKRKFVDERLFLYSGTGATKEDAIILD